MKKTIHSTLLLVCVLFSFKSNAQSFTALYDFANAGTASGRTDPTSVPTPAGLTCASFTAVGTGVSANPNASGRFSFTGWDLGATTGNNTFTGSINLGKYYEVTLTPQTYYSYELDSITFTLQRSGTGIRQYAVRSSVDAYVSNLSASIVPANVNLQVVPTNVFQVTDASTSAENGSKILLTGFGNLTSSVTFRFYGFNAEATTGTFSIDNVRFYGTTTISPTAPNVILSTTSLSFPATAAPGTGSVLNYTLTGNNLLGPVTLTTGTSNFTISDNVAGPFTSSLSIPEAEVSSPKTVYVQFLPSVTGSFRDTIIHSSTSAANKKLALSGDGIDAANLSFNFNSCSNGGVPGLGFTTYSVTGAQVWACSSFGRNTSNGINISGFATTAQENEDWLISPSLQISSISLPVLRFWSRGEFSGPVLEALISTDYSGGGDPNLATWTNLNASFPPLTNIWTLTDGIDLTFYKSFPKLYVAFRYKSSADEGAARWSIDDVDITNRTLLLTTNIESHNFGEASLGSFSEAKKIVVRAIGYGDVTLTPPPGFQVSADNTNYFSAFTFPEGTITNPTEVFLRFAPLSRELKIDGILRFTGTGLDSLKVLLSGTSYPKAETFDAGTYNLSFFGSNFSNNATPEKIALQVQNIKEVFTKLNLDITGVQEVSSDIAMDSLVSKLPHHKYILSPSWSYSFEAPDPNFPPQKTGFVYDSLTTVLVEARAMFTGLYDSVRNGFPEKLPAYPGGVPQSFWASGRLPYMGTFDVNIGGIIKRVRLVVIHAKSATDANSYNRRVYDVRVLKDSLDAYYSEDLVMIVGDYNDKVLGSINTAATNSPYKPFVDNTTAYTALTYALDVAGRTSFISGTSLIDHIIVSNELNSTYINSSTDIEDPRSYISSYNATTASDHLPVFSRFNFAAVVPVSLVSLNAAAKTNQVLVNWKTSLEIKSLSFIVQKSRDGKNFNSFTTVLASGNANGSSYQAIDPSPVTGRNFYRLKQVDMDGSWVYSPVVSVIYGGSTSDKILLFPNPVSSILNLTNSNISTVYTARLISHTGNTNFTFKGSLSQVNQQMNSKLNAIAAGFYVLQLDDGIVIQNLKFIKN